MLQTTWQSIFSVEFAISILRISTPLIFGSMAAIVVRRSGVVCIAFEAMMISAALGGVLGSAYSHSLLIGMLVGLLFSVVIAAVFAYFVLVLNANDMLVGIALNTFGGGEPSSCSMRSAVTRVRRLRFKAFSFRTSRFR